MSVTLYDDDKSTELSTHINDILKEVAKKRYELLDPPKVTRDEVMQIMFNYIKEHKRKIYGGWALNELIKKKNPKDAFYEEFDVPDIEFYSYEPLQDLINICDLLYEKKFKGVGGREAQHTETYTIFFDFEKRCDISYVPKFIYDNIPTINIDGILYVAPQFMIIDTLRAFTTPITSYGLRLNKVFNRLRLMQKHYPIKDVPNYTPITYDSSIKSQLDTVSSFLYDRKSTVLIGYVAYDILIGKHDGIPFYEFISTNFLEDTKALIELLRTKHQNITFTEYYPFFQFYGHNVIISSGEKKIAHVYDYERLCVPYQDIKIDKHTLRVGSFMVVLKFLYIFMFKAKMDHDEKAQKRYEHMIYNIVLVRNQYLKKNKKSIIDDTPFKEFQIACVGTTIDPPRLYREHIEKNKERGKAYVFSYDPSAGYRPRVEDWWFQNTSGNKVQSPKNLKIKLT